MIRTENRGGGAHAAAPPPALARSREAFTAALRAGDAHAACRAYTPEATLVAPPAEIVEGRDAIERFWRAGVDAGMTDLELESLELQHRDAFAYELGRYQLLVDGDDGPLVDRGTYMVVHELQRDGSWLRAAEMFNASGNLSAGSS